MELKTDAVVEVAIRPGSDPVPSTPIGPGKPLSLRIVSISPGRAFHQGMLVSSAVKNPSLFDAAPRALQYVFTDVHGKSTLHPSPAQPGSDIVYYSPAQLDDLLDVEIRYSYDDFDRDRYAHWVEVLRKSAGLPVFSLATLLGGAGGAVAGNAILAFVEKLLGLGLDAVDWRTDGHNDWVSTWKLNISRGGLDTSEAGWVLFVGDDQADAQILAPSEADAGILYPRARDDAYQVDTKTGKLVFRVNGQEVTNEPYLLGYVNGTEEPALDKWTSTAVSAALAEKFFSEKPDVAEDIGSLLGAYNDYTIAKKIGEVDAEFKKDSTDDTQKAKLRAKREALLKNVQDQGLKDVIGDLVIPLP